MVIIIGNVYTMREVKWFVTQTVDRQLDYSFSQSNSMTSFRDVQFKADVSFKVVLNRA